MAISSSQRNGRNGILMSAVLGAATLGMAASSHASIMIDFKLDPAPANRQVVWNGTTLTGANPASAPMTTNYVGGLMLEAYADLKIPGSTSKTNGMGDVSTVFDGVTLEFNVGYAGPADHTALTLGQMGVFTQPLANGTFKFWSKDPDGAGPLNRVLLLTGVIADAQMNGFTGTTSGAMTADQITITGGEILAKAQPGMASQVGSMNFSLLEASAPFAVTGSSLHGFSSNLVGTLNVVPEPAMVGVLSLVVASAALARRRRKSEDTADEPQAE